MSRPEQLIRTLIDNDKLSEAVPLLEAACKRNPRDAQAWSWLGITHARLQAWPKAEFCLRKALALRPDDADARHAMATLLIRKQRFGEATTQLRAAMALRPDEASLYNDLGYCEQRQRHIDSAIEAYQRSLQLDPQQHLAYRNLGLLYEQIHRLEAARDCAQQALSRAPGDVESTLLLAKLEARDKQYAAARQRLAPLLDTGLSPFHQGAANLAMAKILDRLGDPEATFRHLAAGKRAFRALYRISDKDLQQYRNDIRRFRQVFSAPPPAVSPALEPTDDALKVIFLVGFPRSGTTLTEQVLEAHPDIVASHELPVLIELTNRIGAVTGRPFRYPDDVHTLNREEIMLLRDAYRQAMAAALESPPEKDQFVLDKLPLNIVHLGLIAQLFPEGRILLALRDPRDVCLSCYLQSFEMNPAMAQFLSLDDTAAFYRTVMVLLRHYRDTLGINMLTTRYEDIVDDLEGAARRMLDYLGLAWNPAVLQYYRAAQTRRVYTPSYQAVTQPIYPGAKGKWKGYAAQLAPILPMLEELARGMGYRD
jgi:Flp pilus assembly protein TadD